MDPDQDRPPWVPSPRRNGDDTGGGRPLVPAPRAVPAIERLSGPVALAERPVHTTAAPSTAALGAVRHPAAVAVPDAGVTGVLRSWGRAVARLVHAAVDGVRALVGAAAPAPVSR